MRVFIAFAILLVTREYISTDVPEFISAGLSFGIIIAGLLDVLDIGNKIKKLFGRRNEATS